MTPNNLHFTLLRPPILHILRAAGFQSTRPAVLDTLTDLAARYLLLLANITATQCASSNSPVPTFQDVRMAMTEAGVFRPQRTACEEGWLGEDDMRGVEAFLEWAVGDGNREIRRIAGLTTPGGKEPVVIAATGEPPPEDFLAALKKKHSKTGEESRYQGTLLGKQAEDRVIRIEGGPAESIHTWKARQQLQLQNPLPIRTMEIEEVKGRDEEVVEE
ncbi:hypothetical protein FGG08_004580 [Glutinoglossum americanum]|uniref:Bromodomain associated domain-containing protein n=1 Tax=Glutinoglossum americanum TaxID=1670608 RepID=A0A9P8HW67_9PEZI|nr:hypothetical protein FGG08_004580 [Glutinoglossum americanum]